MAKILSRKEIEKLTEKGWKIDANARKVLNDGKIAETLSKTVVVVEESAKITSNSLKAVESLVQSAAKIGEAVSKNLGKTAEIVGKMNLDKITPPKVEIVEKPSVSEKPKTWSFEIKRDANKMIREVIARETNDSN